MSNPLPPPRPLAPLVVPPPPQPAQPQWQVHYVPKRTSHGLHLALTILTFGLWAPVWIVCAILNAGRTRQVRSRNG